MMEIMIVFSALGVSVTQSVEHLSHKPSDQFLVWPLWQNWFHCSISHPTLHLFAPRRKIPEVLSTVFHVQWTQKHIYRSPVTQCSGLQKLKLAIKFPSFQLWLQRSLGSCCNVLGDDCRILTDYHVALVVGPSMSLFKLVLPFSRVN